MWCYAGALLGMALAAQALGLGGVPAYDMQIASLAFAFLLIIFIAVVCKRFARH